MAVGEFKVESFGVALREFDKENNLEIEESAIERIPKKTCYIRLAKN